MQWNFTYVGLKYCFVFLVICFFEVYYIRFCFWHSEVIASLFLFCSWPMNVTRLSIFHSSLKAVCKHYHVKIKFYCTVLNSCASVSVGLENMKPRFVEGAISVSQVSNCLWTADMDLRSRVDQGVALWNGVYLVDVAARANRRSRGIPPLCSREKKSSPLLKFNTCINPP